MSTLEIQMKMRNRYIFGAAMASVALGGVPGLVDRAQAGVQMTAADFSFETSGLAFSLSATQGTAPFGPVLADSGVGSAYGSHAATASVFSSPSGNGSLHTLSSNDWTVGDYYRFDVPTTGITNIVVSFDQIGSSTGPKQFNFVVSADGVNFTTVGGYTIALPQTGTNSTGGTETESSWNNSFSASGYNESYNLSAYPALNNDPSALFEVVDTDSTVTSTAGTNRIDNVIVSGTSSVPEPAALTMLTVAAAGLLLRRRNNKGSD
jgi:hypothetical protein